MNIDQRHDEAIRRIVDDLRADRITVTQAVAGLHELVGETHERHPEVTDRIGLRRLRAMFVGFTPRRLAGALERSMKAEV